MHKHMITPAHVATCARSCVRPFCQEGGRECGSCGEGKMKEIWKSPDDTHTSVRFFKPRSRRVPGFSPLSSASAAPWPAYGLPAWAPTSDRGTDRPTFTSGRPISARVLVGAVPYRLLDEASWATQGCAPLFRSAITLASVGASTCPCRLPACRAQRVRRAHQLARPRRPARCFDCPVDPAPAEQ
jgi:hypothetical protein